jgi:hypothetical protein
VRNKSRFVAHDFSSGRGYGNFVTGQVAEIAAMSPELSEDETRPALPSRQPVTSLEPAASVAQRLGRSVRTIERWVKAGILPPPMQVNGRNLHRAGVMPKPDDT